MPRPPRLQIPDGVYHVTNRGVDRGLIVHDDRDRWSWFHELGNAATNFRWRVFAYALLDNHFHVFLRTPIPNLSDGMHDFEGNFATRFNRRHQRVGPLFQGRFHAVLIESESHLWEVSRYVHLNPYRAGLTRELAQYAWCSYRYYLNPRGAPKWLDYQSVLAEFAPSEPEARIDYKRFVEAGMVSPPRNPLDAARDGLILGSDAFIARFLDESDDANDPRKSKRLVNLQSRPSLDEIVAAVATSFGASHEEVFLRSRHGNLPREVAMFLCRKVGDIPLEKMAQQFGVTPSAVSDTVRRCGERMKKSETLRVRIERLREIVGGD
jgi:putative transposase